MQTSIHENVVEALAQYTAPAETFLDVAREACPVFPELFCRFCVSQVTTGQWSAADMQKRASRRTFVQRIVRVRLKKEEL